MEITQELTKFALTMVDRIVQYRAPSSSLKKLKELRNAFEITRSKDDEKEKEKEEQKRKDKEKEWASLSAAERRKKIELEEKRARKRMTKRVRF